MVLALIGLSLSRNIPGSNYPKARQQAPLAGRWCWIFIGSSASPILCSVCSYIIFKLKLGITVFMENIHQFARISSSSIFTLLLVLQGRLTSSTTSARIRITWGIIKTKTSDNFLEGFCVIKGQSHWDPHQNDCWCNALVNVISKTKKK